MTEQSGLKQFRETFATPCEGQRWSKPYCWKKSVQNKYKLDE